MKKLFPLFIFFLVFAACEKEVNIKLNEGDKKIVVEGVIETNEVPYVTITRSIGFFDEINLGSLEYVHGAQITITDQNTSTSIELKEYTLDTTVGGKTYSFSIYGPDILDPNAMNFKGQVGHIYRMQMLCENKSYDASTQIPHSAGLDSLWLEPVPGKEDSFSVVKALYRDPDTFGNCVKLQTRHNKYIKDGYPELFLTSFNSVYDDNIINGTDIPVSIDIGYDRSRTYTTQEMQNMGFMRHGDTLTIKWSAIDKFVYTFWQTLSFSEGSVGNPFASPVQVQGNIKGALGVWGGYGSSFYTVIDSL